MAPGELFSAAAGSDSGIRRILTVTTHWGGFEASWTLRKDASPLLTWFPLAPEGTFNETPRTSDLMILASESVFLMSLEGA